ncbi:MAG: hypothetical protein AAFO91_04010, partial [Bacteroidota bacterium]
MTFVLEDTPEFSTQIRNLYLTEKILADSTFEMLHMYKGLATLYQAIYFYMEPAHSKVLLNRSKMNYPPGVSGELGNSFFDLTSYFSRSRKAPQWILSRFFNEFLSLDLPSAQSLEANSFSIMLNFECFLRSRDENYHTSSQYQSMPILTIFSSNNEPVLKVDMNLMDMDMDEMGGTFTYAIDLREVNEFSEINFDLEGDLNSIGSPLAPRMIVLSIFYVNPSEVIAEMEVRVTRFQTIDTRKIGRFSLKYTDLCKLVVGHHDRSAFPSDPSFLVLLHDLQVFQGGYFHTRNDPDDLSCLSGDALSVAYCKQNPRLSRWSGNASLDRNFEAQLSTSSGCADMVFNDLFIIDNCEIVGDGVCLVCEDTYTIVNGLCTQPMTSSTSFFDGYLREYINYNGVEVDSLVSKVYNRNESGFLSSNFYVTGTIQMPFTTDPDTIKDVRLNANSFKLLFTNTKAYDSKVQSVYLDGVNLGRRFIYFDPASDFKSFSVQGEKISFNLYTVKDLCTRTNTFLKGGYSSILCSKIADFRSFEYFPRVFESVPESDGRDFVIPASSKYPGMVLPCRNNCDCSSGSALTCTCSSSQYEVVLSVSPLITHCVDCSTLCETCKQKKCITCSPSNAFDNGEVLDFRGVHVMHFFCLQVSQSVL